MAQPTPIYIVASPRPRVGKTVLARLLVEFLRASRRPVAAYDLNPRDPVLAGYFPRLVTPIDIADTRGQMMLFDRLIARSAATRIIDVGYGAYDQFFAVMAEIGFVREARRRMIEPVVLFAADHAAITVRAYADLRRDLPDLTVVPVHNEFVSVTCDKDDFPPTRAACRMPASRGCRRWCAASSTGRVFRSAPTWWRRPARRPKSTTGSPAFSRNSASSSCGS